MLVNPYIKLSDIEAFQYWNYNVIYFNRPVYQFLVKNGQKSSEQMNIEINIRCEVFENDGSIFHKGKFGDLDFKIVFKSKNDISLGVNRWDFIGINLEDPEKIPLLLKKFGEELLYSRKRIPNEVISKIRNLDFCV